MKRNQIDPPQVVRCQDCKWRIPVLRRGEDGKEHLAHYCSQKLTSTVDLDYFCSDGKRRDGVKACRVKKD